MPAGEVVPGQSLFQLESTWTDQKGETVSLEELGGTPVVLAMVYTHCEHACPRIVGDMRRIQADLGERAEETRFVLVSIDPARDTVERMAKFADETGIDEDGWRVLRGEEADVRELAAVLGVQYKRVSESDFAHSNLIHVLDRTGVIAHRQEGLGTAPTATVAALEGLLATPDR
ncbi:MAG: SCO family protein [Myxococcota bacterium]